VHRARVRRRVAVVIGLCFASFAVSDLAVADTYGLGPPDHGYRPDNFDHDWCWSTGWPGGSWSTDATARHTYLNDTTNFSGGSLQTCNSGTDVYWKASTTQTAYGSYICDDLNSGICDNASITILNSTILPQSNRRKTMCHELGHTGGLAHYSGTTLDCMVSGLVTNTTYRAHAISHLNALG